jgi:ABC-type multidrug transport system ATPase subunit
MPVSQMLLASGFELNCLDHIIVLQDGQVAEQGTHEELVAITGGVYHRLWQAQLSESTQAVDEDQQESVVAPAEQT